MLTCANCSESLLDFLYGLLEAQEAEMVQTHLAGCLACQQVLNVCKEQQNLFARAARKYREVPAFEAPAEETAPLFGHFPAAAPAAQVATPLRPVRAWRRWATVAAAAAVLLAVGGVAAAYQKGAASRQKALADARRDVEALDAKLLAAAFDYKADLKSLPSKLEGKFLHVDLLGPASHQLGAATPFRLRTLTPAGQLAPTRVTVRLLDPGDGDRVLFHEEHDSPGELRFALPGTLTVHAGIAVRLVVEARGSGTSETIEQVLTVEAPTYLTHIALNKPQFRPGEVVFFRTATLQRYSSVPIAQPVQMAYALYHLVGGTPVPKRELQGALEPGGIGGGEFAVTDDLADGEYVLMVGESATQKGAGIRTAVRHFRIDRDDLPKLIVQRQQYQPGETIDLFFRGRRLLNGPAAPNQALIVTATANKKALALDPAANGKPLQIQTDKDGNAKFAVTLPKELQAGDLTLEAQVPDGKINDRVKQVIAVAQPRLAADFFPEGGNLIAGVANRVYFRFHVPQGMPAGLQAVVEDSKQQEVVALQLGAEASKAVPSQILGAFTFTPRFGEVYRVRLSMAGKQLDRLPLPAVLQGGVALTVPSGVIVGKEPLRIHLQDTNRGELLVVASCRGRTVDQKIVHLAEGQAEVTLSTMPGAHGVVRITVYEKQDNAWQSAAERLVYRVPSEYLKLSAMIDPNKDRFAPGERLHLGIEARNEVGVLVPAWLHAMVIDEKALGSGREASVPALFWLTNELREPEDLEDADILLGDATAAPEALDFFLGTQGWRRFAKGAGMASDKLALKAVEGDNGFAQKTVPAALIVAGTRLPAVQKRFTKAVKQREELLALDVQHQTAALTTERERAVAHAETAADALLDFQQQTLANFRTAAAAALLTLLAAGTLLLVWSFVVALRARRSPRPWLVGAFCTMLLALVVFAATGSLRTVEDTDGRDLLAWLKPPLQFVVPPLALGNGPPQMDKGADAESKVTAQVFAFETRQAADGVKGGLGAAELRTQQTGQLKNKDAAAPMPPPGAALAKNAASNERFEYARNATESNYSQKGGGGFGGAAVAPQFKGGKAQSLQGDPAAAGQSNIQAFGGQADSGKKFNAAPIVGPAVLLEYAHIHSPVGAQPQDMVLWSPLLTAADGTARVSFDLSGKPATYQILIYGHTSAGRLGAFRGKLEAK